MMNSPTQRTYDSLNQAYEYFNAALFENTLPPCLITMRVHRHKGAYGYFSYGRFAQASNPKEITDEIALNSNHFHTQTRGEMEVLSTLVHEMVHLWQHHFGKCSRAGYHNKEWGAKMRAIGLIPSHTGQRGGRETGQQVTHYIEKSGAFAQAYCGFQATGVTILYQDRESDGQEVTRKKKAASKTKYTCSGCGLNAWAKPETSLMCGECVQSMQAENTEVLPAR